MVEGNSVLTVENLNRKNDQGSYICVIEDVIGNKNQAELGILIHEKKSNSVKLYEANGKYKFQVDEGRKLPVQWILEYSGDPTPEFHLSKNDITLWPSNNEKFSVSESQGKRVKVRISQPTLTDSGVYILRADNGFESKELKLTLIVNSPPKVNINNITVSANLPVKIRCSCRGFPPSDMSWAFVSCPQLRNCIVAPRKPTVDNSIASSNLTDIYQYADIEFTPSEAGIVICMAKNSKGSDRQEATLQINDTKTDFDFLDPDREIVEGESEITLTCAASVYYFDKDIQIYHNESLVIPTENIQILDTSTKFSYRKTLLFSTLRFENGGRYECIAKSADSDVENKRDIQYLITETKAPQFSQPEINSVRDVSISEPFKYFCHFDGAPHPKIEWSKNGAPLETSSRINILENDMLLNISHIAPEDEGEYSCTASNRLGSQTATLKLRIKNLPMSAKYWVLGFLVVIIILAILLVIFYIRIRRARAVSN